MSGAFPQTPVSLEKPVGEGEETELADLVKDETRWSPSTKPHSTSAAREFAGC